MGYIILIAVIGSMAATMLHERGRVHKIELEATQIREANQTINAAHRHITILATLGEIRDYMGRGRLPKVSVAAAKSR